MFRNMGKKLENLAITKRLSKTRLRYQRSRARRSAAERTSLRLPRGGTWKKLSEDGNNMPKPVITTIEERRVKLYSALKNWQGVFKRLRQLKGYSTGNSVWIYNSGDALFRALWDAIDDAKTEILVETYILNPDNIGGTTVSKLVDACHRGVHVTLMYDSMGSNSLFLFPFFLDELEAAGATIIPFNCLIRGIWTKRSRLFRDHRKIVVIDDAVGFCGGMNISEEYCGVAEGGTGAYRDSHVRVIGPAVKDLKNVFLDSITEATPKGYELRERAPVLAPIDSNATAMEPAKPKNVYHVKEHKDVIIQLLRSNVFREHFHIQRALTLTLNKAKHDILISNAYFFPPRSTMNALVNAVKRGVDVRIITAGEGYSDVPFVQRATEHMIHYLVKRNVRVFQMADRTLHAKTISIDSVYASVGSFNLDIISHTRNLEVSLTMIDPEIAHTIDEQFHEDLSLCTEMTIDTLENFGVIRKVVNWGCYHLLRFGSSRVADFFMGDWNALHRPQKRTSDTDHPSLH